MVGRRGRKDDKEERVMLMLMRAGKDVGDDLELERMVVEVR